jgi:hypothetical protein
MKAGDKVRKIWGQRDIDCTGVVAGIMELVDGTKMVHVLYPEYSVPILEFQKNLILVGIEKPIQLSLFEG